uniref:Uncharacterized protein n=1 Tax=Prochloron didemni P2-Fiji TaxID=910454 RepID=G0XS45_PRODI|nr:hypothetical protein [Prochloron didemni P2-Fiji]
MLLNCFVSTGKTANVNYADHKTKHFIYKLSCFLLGGPPIVYNLVLTSTNNDQVEFNSNQILK